MASSAVRLAVLLVAAVSLVACQKRIDPPPQPAAATAPPAPVFEQIGKASWYGPWHHGRKTASGEKFNMNDLTAAHRTLPLGTDAKVTNLENGRTVNVTVNDRGPYKDGRIIDLSRRAAEVLGIKEQGLARVKIQVVPDSTQVKTATIGN